MTLSPSRNQSPSRNPVPSEDGLLLAVDSGSPRVSVALGRAGKVLAVREMGLRHSSGPLLPAVGEALDEIGATPGDLAGIVALRGPGSFTGLRVGLATALGLADALSVPATAVPTLPVLAQWACREIDSPTGPAEGARLLAAVDAIRGEWFVQEHEAGPNPSLRASGEPRLVSAAELGELGPGWLVGFGVGEALTRSLEGARHLEEAGSPGGDGTEPPAVLEPGPLAPAALDLVWALAGSPRPIDWDPATLTSPLYLRPPAVRS